MIMRCPNCGNAGLVQQPYGLKCAFCGYLDERDIQRAGSRDDAAITRRRRTHKPRSAAECVVRRRYLAAEETSMRVYVTMQSLGCEPRHCKHGGTFARGERMNATDDGWFCDDCAEHEDDEPDPAYPFGWNSYETEIRP